LKEEKKMKNKIANSRRLDILGNGDCSSDRESPTAMRNRWRQKLGYCSIFAAVPTILAAQLSEARPDEAKKPEASVAELGARRLPRPNMSFSNPALLKRQSEFRLPHQNGSFDMLAALGGTDDCPGRTILGASYTATAPFIDSGDTTGANDTITSLPSFYYYYSSYDAQGPDHVYSFTLTGRGPNPQIEVSSTSGTYRPLIYVLIDGANGGCPLGTANTASSPVAVLTDSRWTAGSSTATLDNNQMNYLPLNVPLHLFVDSRANDANGSGAYTIRMQDVTIAPTSPNQIDRPDVFVRQHYLDFLNREPDPLGMSFWTNVINLCGTDAGCIEAKRVNVSAAYFLSIEFRETGYLVYRMHKASYGNLPGLPVPIKLNEFLPDTQQIGKGVIVNQTGWEQVLENNKQSFTSDFVQRSRFTSAFPTSMTPGQFVDKLFANAGLTPSGADYLAAIDEFGLATNSADLAARARALRRIAEDSTFAQQDFNRAFVLMQYFGYLRRNPNDAPELTRDFQGYNFWLNKLNKFNGDYNAAEMVKAFIDSGEYRQRF
jgi:hypothetical protein